MTERVFAWLLRRRWLLLAAVVALTAVLGALAGRVKPDYSVEHFFPVWSDSREVYDRFKIDFPHEDAQALVIVRAADLFSRDGLARLEALEEALLALPHVTDVDGPMSVQDIAGDFGDLTLEELFPAADLPDEEIERRREIATTDPVFAWNLAAPDGSAITIRVSLEPIAAADDEGRQRFYQAALELVEAHAHDGQEIVISGLPVIRARFARMVGADLERLLPLTLLVVMAILFLTYLSIGITVAGLLTVVASLVWSVGFMGLCGFDFTVLSSILPVVVLIISMSDTVHIVNDFVDQRLAGNDRDRALVTAMVGSAGPCLATEIVIACGFLSLIAVNIVGIVQFGLAAAGAMMFTWLANVTVLPLVLSFTSNKPLGGRAGAPPLVRLFARVVGWIGRQTTRRPRHVVGVGALVFAAAAAVATGAEKLSYSFDDLYPESDFYKELRFAEETSGGLVPVAIYVESLDQTAENPVLEPEIVRLLDRSARFLESFPEIRRANSFADFLRKGHRLFVGGAEEGDDEDAEDAFDLAADGLPDSRELAAQEILFIDEDRMLRDLLSFDRRAAAALAHAVDTSSRRTAEIFVEVDAWVAAEEAKLPRNPDGSPRYRIASTGQFRIFHEVNETLVEGLIASFAGAVLAMLVVFCIVLRSVKLGLVGIIPNVSPMILAVAFMTLAKVTLRPSTVVLFSIVLVIAADDTMQYLARLRAQYRKARARGAADIHREGAIATLHETGLPMFVTSTAISAGFLLLMMSELRGTADLGLLIGVTLFCAVFADLFLAPILVMKARPKLVKDPAQAPAPEQR